MYSALKTGEEEWLLSREVFGPAAPDQQLLITSATRSKQWLTGNGGVHLLTRPDDVWGLLLPQGLDQGYQRNYQGLSNHQTLLFFHVGTSKVREKERKLWGILIAAFQCLQREKTSRKDRGRIFSATCGGKMRNDGYELKWEVLAGYEGKFFHGKDSQEVEQRPREDEQSSSLEVFKTQLDRMLSNMAWSQADPALNRRLDVRPEVSSKLNFPNMLWSLLKRALLLQSLVLREF